MRNIATNDQTLAIDAKSLGDLKRSAGARDPGAIKETAKQFEVLFMNMLMKSMREASPKDGMMSSSAGDMYTGMLDQQFAQKMAARGTGLADVIARQLGAQQKPVPAGGAAALETTTALGASTRMPTSDAGRTQNRQLSVRFSDVAGLRKISQLGDASASSPVAGALAQAGAIGDKAAAFFERMKAHASEAATATGIPAKFMLGQAALESGWGKKEIRHTDGSTSHNLFGIKAGANWSGPTVSVTTTEYINGVATKAVEKFRAYASYADSFKDYASLITKSPRYSAVASSSGSVEGFANSLQRAGYATDPRYAEKLSRTINHVIAIARSKTSEPTGGNQA